MKSSNDVSLRKIRSFHKEIRKIKREIKTLENDLEKRDYGQEYWSESSLYSSPAEKKTKRDEQNSELDFIVPWQMG